MGNVRKVLPVQTFSYILISDSSVNDRSKKLNIRGTWVAQ